MNRRDLFKKLGLGVFTVLIAPRVFNQEDRVNTSKYIVGCDPINPNEMSLVAIYDKGLGMVVYNKKNKKHLRITRNGFYAIGDVFSSYDTMWIVVSYDDKYYYCLPQ